MTAGVDAWPRAWGGPLGTGIIRARAEDFRVDEQIGFGASGSGEHLLIQVEKTGANTHWVVQQLSGRFQTHPRNIGFSGLKDRHAVTRQWFTVPWPIKEPLPDLENDHPDWRILSCERHHRKLQRGSHQGNAFEIRITGCAWDADRSAIDDRLQQIRSHGVPNYFGPQRFGRDNMATARMAAAGKRLGRKQRGFALSAARAWLFNRVLARRVEQGTWNEITVGDSAILNGRSALFVADETIRDDPRLKQLEIHPTGIMWGRSQDPVAAATDAERQCLADEASLRDWLESAGLSADRRALRLKADDLAWELAEDCLTLHFSLTSGAFATSVLREIVSVGK